MKKLITGIVTAVTLTMSLSAGVVDSGLTLNSFNYAFSINDNKCEELPSFFTENMYTKYKNGDGDFMQYNLAIGVINVVKSNDNYFIFFEDKNECELFQNSNNIENVKLFVRHSLLIADSCKIKPTINEVINVSNSAAEYQNKNLGKFTFGDIVKHGIKETGLKCN